MVDLVFDVIVTFSSVEHSGLGRTVMPNPWGDVLEIARTLRNKDGWSTGGRCHEWRDGIEFNAHRIYGEVLAVFGYKLATKA